MRLSNDELSRALLLMLRLGVALVLLGATARANA